MQLSKFFVALAVSCILCFCAVSKRGSERDTLTAGELPVYGRYYFNDRQQLALVSSAVHFGFSFEGKACSLYVSLPGASGHNYLQYELNGQYIKRIRIDGNSKQPLIIHAAGKGRTELWIYKATEAHTGDILVEKISATNIRPLQHKKTRVIEFIGNSITCGAAADTTEIPCGKGMYHDQHNAYMAYGPRVARALGTEFILSSVSGIGIYRNWNSDGPVMPEVYEKLNFQTGSALLWDFNKIIPDVVSIALGTNDFSSGDGKRPRLPFDSAAFTAGYIGFVKTVMSKYPQAQIALLSSPMVQGERNEIFQQCLQRVKQKIDREFPNHRPVALFFFKPMRAGGCTGHPSVADHERLAAELLPFIRSQMD